VSLAKRVGRLLAIVAASLLVAMQGASAHPSHDTGSLYNGSGYGCSYNGWHDWWGTYENRSIYVDTQNEGSCLEVFVSTDGSYGYQYDYDTSQASWYLGNTYGITFSWSFHNGLPAGGGSYSGWGYYAY